MPKGTPLHVTLRLWHALTGSTLPERPSLLDDLELVALVRPDAGGAQQRAQGPGGAALASDNFADITLGDFEFDHAIVELLDENFVGGVDQRFRDQLNQSARICGGSGHRNQFMLLACSVLAENSIAGGHACTNRYFQAAEPALAGAGAGFENSLFTRSDICAPFETQYSTRSRFSSTLAGLVRGL